MILRYLYVPLFARCLFSLMQLLLSPLIIFLPIRKIFRIFKYSPLFEIRLLSIRTDWATSFITGGKFAAPPPYRQIGNFYISTFLHIFLSLKIDCFPLKHSARWCSGLFLIIGKHAAAVNVRRRAEYSILIVYI